jgi:hypothetical protein
MSAASRARLKGARMRPLMADAPWRRRRLAWRRPSDSARPAQGAFGCMANGRNTHCQTPSRAHGMLRPLDLGRRTEAKILSIGAGTLVRNCPFSYHGRRCGSRQYRDAWNACLWTSTRPGRDLFGKGCSLPTRLAAQRPQCATRDCMQQLVLIRRTVRDFFLGQCIGAPNPRVRAALHAGRQPVLARRASWAGAPITIMQVHNAGA